MLSSWYIYIMQQFYVLCADFYNWNRVKVRYCDGSSFTGDVEAVDTVCVLDLWIVQSVIHGKNYVNACFQFRRKNSITGVSEFGAPSSMIYLL